MTRTKGLPRSIPQSLRYAKPPPSPLLKARVHNRRAEKLRDKEKKQARDGDVDPTTPHLQFLERMSAVMAAVEVKRVLATKEYKGLLGKDGLRPHELLGHFIGTLPKARTERIFADPRIGQLNALLMRPGRKIAQVIETNERLLDFGLKHRDFITMKRDLKFNLGLHAYKSGQALAFYFVVIEAAASPKVRKKQNLVQDVEVLTLANEILREVATHIIQEMQFQKDKILDVGNRRDDAVLAKGGRRA